MPAPRGPHAKHERNLERNLESRDSTAPREPRALPSVQAEGPDAAAKLARDAAMREAVRRVAERGGGGSEPG